MHRPYRFDGIECDDTQSFEPSPAKVRGPYKSEPPRPSASPTFAQRLDRSPAFPRDDASIPRFQMEDTGPVFNAPNSAAQQQQQETVDIFFDVLVSLKSVLSSEQFEVLEQELSAFSEEYRHEHYTACGLRIGRTLEHVVYALARAWGVNVNRAALQVLSDLGSSFEQLSRAIIDYATSGENEKAQ
jgi:hypothetical protein